MASGNQTSACDVSDAYNKPGYSIKVEGYKNTDRILSLDRDQAVFLPTGFLRSKIP